MKKYMWLVLLAAIIGCGKSDPKSVNVAELERKYGKLIAVGYRMRFLPVDEYFVYFQSGDSVISRISVDKDTYTACELYKR